MHISLSLWSRLSLELLLFLLRDELRYLALHVDFVDCCYCLLDVPLACLVTYLIFQELAQLNLLRLLLLFLELLLLSVLLYSVKSYQVPDRQLICSSQAVLLRV